eukprot:5478224-Pleurochrysis_carterae.AAC.1
MKPISPLLLQQPLLGRAVGRGVDVQHHRRVSDTAGGASDAVVEADGSAEPEAELAALMELDGSDELTDSSAMRSFLKQHFGERAANVLNVLVLRPWEAFGKVYAAACSAWECDTT